MKNTRSLSRGLLVVVKAAIAAFVIALLLQGVWSALIVANLMTSPTVPWAVPAMGLLIWLAWRYLGGNWWPESTSDARRRHLRAGAVRGPALAWALLAGGLSIAALAGYWIVMTRLVRMPGNVLPDMSKYPWLTTALIIGTGSLIGPVLEQAGFWGYGQVMLEDEFRGPVAVLIAAILFAVGPHPPAGAVLWPKFVFYFLAGLTFGALAYFTRSILPGILVHFGGDLLFFTVVWPHDTTRPLIGESGADLWFWLNAAQALVFTALALLAFSRLAKTWQPTYGMHGTVPRP